MSITFSNPLKASSNWPNGDGESDTCGLASGDERTAKSTSGTEYPHFWTLGKTEGQRVTSLAEAPCLSAALCY